MAASMPAFTPVHVCNGPAACVISSLMTILKQMYLKSSSYSIYTQHFLKGNNNINKDGPT